MKINFFTFLIFFGILFSNINLSAETVCDGSYCIDEDGDLYNKNSGEYLFGGPVEEGYADYEWIIGRSSIRASHYIGRSASFVSVDCTASFGDKVIGGGIGMTTGGVANVTIMIPNKYYKKNLSVWCE